MRATIFVIFLALSPWVWLLGRNPAAFAIQSDEWYRLRTPARLSYINTLRGQSGQIGRLFVNKVTWTVREGLVRIAESFDPQYLFFEGDLDPRRSLRTSGPVYLTWLPMIVWGLSRKRVGVLAISVAPAMLVENHYHTGVLLFFLAWLTWLTSCGMEKFLKSPTSRAWKVAYFTVFAYQVLNAWHTYWFHYAQ